MNPLYNQFVIVGKKKVRLEPPQLLDGQKSACKLSSPCCYLPFQIGCIFIMFILFLYIFINFLAWSELTVSDQDEPAHLMYVDHQGAIFSSNKWAGGGPWAQEPPMRRTSLRLASECTWACPTSQGKEPVVHIKQKAMLKFGRFDSGWSQDLFLGHHSQSPPSKPCCMYFQRPIALPKSKTVNHIKT